MTLIDITQPLRNGMPVWPGDTEFSFHLSGTMEETGSVNIGTVTMSNHTGTHIDAPFHYDNHGKQVHELDIDLYVGKVRVIELSGVETIGRRELERIDLNGVTRLLIHTKSWNNLDEFPRDFTHFRPDTAPYLAEKGIRLIGLDSPSVDPLESKAIPAHLSFLRSGIHILENAVLDHVEPNDYHLMALPLNLHGADGSPVRAILQTIE